MPFAVSKWPASADPRSAMFNFQGWEGGSTPPYHWLLKTTEALPPFDPLNDGLLIPWSSGDVGIVSWSLLSGPGQPITVLLSSDGYLIELSPIAPDTHAFTIFISAGAPGTATGHLHQVRPTPIKVQGPLIMAGDAAFDANVPNDLTLVPAKWDA